MVTATDVLNMLIEDRKAIRGAYSHIKLPFTLKEVECFMEGKPGANLSRQIAQALSAIGACVVDQKLATPSTVVAYKALWAIEKTETCKYCGKAFTFKLMGGSNRGVCSKPKCTFNSMRESM